MNPIQELAVSLVVDKDEAVWLGQPLAGFPGINRDVSRRLVCDHIYRHWYAPGHALAELPQRDAEIEIRARLEALLPTFEAVETGWTLVDTLPLGGAVLQKDGLKAWFKHGEWRNVAEKLEVLAPRAFRNRMPGYFVPNFGELPSEPLVRLYLALTPEGALSYVQLLDQIAELKVPIHTKIATNRADYYRADAVVLYASADQVAPLWPRIAAILKPLSSQLRPVCPALTYQLAPGVGYAEDPGGGQSFGLSRVARIADALLADPGASQQQRQFAIEKAFREGGFDLDALWRQPYSVRPPPPSSLFSGWTLPAIHRHVAGVPKAKGVDALVETDELVAGFLEESVWRNGDDVQWLGAPSSVLGKPVSGPQGLRIAETLGPGLYNGLAGVGAFLAEDGSVQRRELAAAAFRCALRRIPHGLMEGYFDGRIGILCAMLRAAIGMGDHSLSREALAGLADTDPIPRDFKCELLTGLAGSLAALASVAPFVGRDLLTRLAGPRIDALLQQRMTFAHGIGWQADIPVQDGWLAGMSHGLSGIALGLVRIGEHVQIPQLTLIVEETLALEDSCFDPVTANWADMRAIDGAPVRRRESLAWCHGSPGILVARSFVTRALGRKELEVERIARLRFGDVVAQLAAKKGGDMSLCHGRVGLAECWRLATGDEAPLEELASELGRSQVRDWPVGTSPGTSPGLMLGVAGIGIAYRRARGSPSGWSPLAP